MSDGMVLQLQTPTGLREWHRFPSEQVTINGIHYQVHNNQLDAIGAEDNTIRGEQLLTTLNGAPLAIRLNQSLTESQLRWENDTLFLNNLTLVHLPAQTPIYFHQQGFTWATLQDTLQPAKPQTRRRRALPMEPRELSSPLKDLPSAAAASVTSSAGKPTSWMGDLWAWGKKLMVGSYSKPVSLDPLEATLSSKPVVCSDPLLQQAVSLEDECQEEEMAYTPLKPDVNLLKQAMCSMPPIDRFADTTLHVGNSYNTNHTLAQSGLEHGNQYTKCVNL